MESLMMNEIEARLRDANDLVVQIASCGRNFFRTPEGEYGRFLLQNSQVLWRDERSGNLMPIVSDRDHAGFSHGGTLRWFLGDLRSWIMNGEPAPGGAFGPHWAYPEEDCIRLRESACEMRFLHWDEEILARSALRRNEDPQRPPQSEFRLGRNQAEWTVVMQWPTEDGMDRHCVAWGPMPRKTQAVEAIASLRLVPEAEPSPSAPIPR
jgi:hypothetical protein